MCAKDFFEKILKSTLPTVPTLPINIKSNDPVSRDDKRRVNFRVPSPSWEDVPCIM